MIPARHSRETGNSKPASRRIYNSNCAARKIFADHSRRKPDQGLRAGRIQVTAVRGVSLAVEPGSCRHCRAFGFGQIHAVLLAGRVDAGHRGRVVIDGVDFGSLSDAERTRLRKHRIGFVFQKFNLLPTLSAMAISRSPTR